jgi:hypothetical protein
MTLQQKVSLDATFSHISARQEGLARAYIRAVCATAGCGVTEPTPDDDKIDFTVSSRVIGSVRTKPKIDIQSKCEVGDVETQAFSYTIDRPTYDALRDTRVANPRILVLVRAPRDIDHWLNQSHSSLSLSHCGYWVSLKGLPELPDGQATKTIRVDATKIFTPHSLQLMMSNAGNGHELGRGL